jgi:hypothetical protein
VIINNNTTARNTRIDNIMTTAIVTGLLLPEEIKKPF